MEEKKQKEPKSFINFFGLSIAEGWTESREKFGLAIDIALAISAVGIVGFTWYSKHHSGFDEQIWEGRMNYWFALIPVGLWAIWFVYHVLRASHGIYLKQYAEHQKALDDEKTSYTAKATQLTENFLQLQEKWTDAEKQLAERSEADKLVRTRLLPVQDDLFAT